MDKYTPQTGDIIMIDSDRFAAKCVKFFMTAPTLWHQIYRYFTKSLEPVYGFHVAMILNDGWNLNGTGDIIEQQSEVRISDWNPEDKQIIFRKINLTEENKEDLRQEALSDIGQKYDILNIFGKFLTWLTNIKWFARYMEQKDKNICVNRVLSWYWKAVGDRFGYITFEEATTHSWMKKLIEDERYEIVYKKEML